MICRSSTTGLPSGLSGVCLPGEKTEANIRSSGNCNTRETVLKRDGTNVETSSACAATSGTWVSPYDGATWTAASDVDIDHMVPLSNAWQVRGVPVFVEVYG